jgi:hypothetical protein
MTGGGRVARVKHPAGLAVGDQGGILGRIGSPYRDWDTPMPAMVVVAARKSGAAARGQGEAYKKRYEQRSRESAKSGARLFTHYSLMVLFPAPQIRFDKTKLKLRPQRESSLIDPTFTKH